MKGLGILKVDEFLNQLLQTSIRETWLKSNSNQHGFLESIKKKSPNSYEQICVLLKNERLECQVKKLYNFHPYEVLKIIVSILILILLLQSGISDFSKVFAITALLSSSTIYIFLKRFQRISQQKKIIRSSFKDFLSVIERKIEHKISPFLSHQ